MSRSAAVLAWSWSSRSCIAAVCRAFSAVSRSISARSKRAVSASAICCCLRLSCRKRWCSGDVSGDASGDAGGDAGGDCGDVASAAPAVGDDAKVSVRRGESRPLLSRLSSRSSTTSNCGA